MTTIWKRTALVLGAVLIGSLAGCTEAPPATDTGTGTTAVSTATTATAPTTTVTTTTTEATATTTRPISYADMGTLVESDFDIFLGGAEFHLVDDADPILAALGEPQEIEESKMFGGLWVDSAEYYHYGSFVIGVVGYDNKRAVECAIISDDSIVLNKGIRVGCTKEDLRAAYGEAEYELDSDFQYAIYKDGIRYGLVFYFDAVDENGKFYQTDTVQEIRFTTDYFQWTHAPEQ